MIANTVFSFIDKEQTEDTEIEEKNQGNNSGKVVSQLENTVVSQLNLSIDILDFYGKLNIL